MQEMPSSERPISEEFRLVAKAWCEADAAARLLEETRLSVLSKLTLDFQASMRGGGKEVAAMEGKIAMSAGRAEHFARASDEYREHIEKMVSAKTEANLRRVQMKYVEMKFSEWQSSDANARRERQMGRAGP